MLNDFLEDFKQEYCQSTYRGGVRKAFHAVTSPGFQAIAGYRFGRWLTKHHIPLLGVVIQRLMEVWTGISIPPETKIGSGLLIFHFGGIIINSKTVIGKHCKLHHGVTIGNRKPGGPSPQIGDRVMIGAGAKILGGVRIGNDAEIGANAVVLADVPAGGVAVGIPAKVIRVRANTQEIKEILEQV